MYDTTKTRMLLMTAVLAAVAALFASGANAIIPADTGSAFATQESLGIGRYAVLPSATKVAQPSAANARIPADTSSAFAAQESLRVGRYLATPRSTQGKIATAPAFPSGDELDTAISTAMAIRAARESGTLSGEQQAPQATGRTAANDAAHFPDTSDVVSRYLGNDRMGTSPFPDGYRGRP